MEVKVIGQMDNTIDHTFESANRVYGVGGISPTIPTCGGGEIQPKILEVKKIGVIACFAMAGSENFGLKPNGGDISKTLKASNHDIAILERACREQNVIKHSYKGFYHIRSLQKAWIVASRGRNPENPSNRNPGIHLEQRLEINLSGLCNTITSVQKDNMVLEIYGDSKDKTSN